MHACINANLQVYIYRMWLSQGGLKVYIARDSKPWRHACMPIWACQVCSVVGSSTNKYSAFMKCQLSKVFQSMPRAACA